MARSEPSDSVVVTVSASSTVSSGPCIINAVALASAAVSCTVQLYDPPVNTTTTTGATLRGILASPAGGDTPSLFCDGGIAFNNGCIAVVVGAGAQATVMFSRI